MKIIKITESKKDKMSDYAEKALRSMGKLMQCIEDLDEGSMGERDDDYDDDWDDDDDMGSRNGGGGGGMGQRRYRRESGGMGEKRSRLTGRFIR